MRPTHIKSAVNISYDSEALKELSKCNDKQYWSDRLGIIKIDESRWSIAQKFEIEGWSRHWSDHVDDRSTEHDGIFNEYKCVDKNLGDVVELGCGPFTQVRHLMSKRGFKVNRLTLVDPLINSYATLSNCSYKNGSLCGLSVELVNSKAEDFLTFTRLESYDTVICINVLEHVQDVQKIFENINKMLIPGGTLILGERTYNNLDIDMLYDIGHPIRIKSVVIDDLIKNYDVLYRSKIKDHDGYVIARKIC